MLMRSEMQRRIVAEALSWRGTEYHPHAQIKGTGVDCAHLLIAVFSATGRIDAFDPGFYPRDWHLHRSDELFAHWVDRFGVRIRKECAEVGDVALFRFGRTFSHGGIIVDDDGSIVHAYVDRGVIVTRLSEEPLEGREWMCWRIA